MSNYSKTKCTMIHVFDSDQVVQHILPLERVEKRKWKRKKAEQVLTYHHERRKDDKNHDSSGESDMEHNFGMPGAGPMETDDGDLLYGKEVFKFRSLKKKGQMTMKAETVASTPTPPRSKKFLKGTPGRNKGQDDGTTSKTPSSSNLTPCRTPRRRSHTNEPLTPVVVKNISSLCSHVRAETTTPYRLRKRNETCPEGSSDDSVDETSSEEEKDSPSFTDLNNSSKKRNNIETNNMAASAENYFDLHSMNPITSDRTLSNLERPHMDLATMQELLLSVKEGHDREISNLMECHRQLFDKWMLKMCNGFNILLHGFGSKRSLLESFRESHLLPFTHLLINGYFPGLTVKHILNSITEEVLDESKGFTNNFKQLEFIEDAFKKNDTDFYLIINNIDGIMLRSEKAQNVLSLLATIPGVHLIASVDHINAPLLWNEIQFFRYRWLWFDTPTFQHYDAENSYENSLMIQQSGSLALSSLVHVMKSLTPNAKRIFLLLAEYQLNGCENSIYDGMSFQTLYHKCREEFLVNSDLTLQAQLIEFKDHRLLRSKKNIEGIEHLLIPIDKITLKEFLEQHKDVS